MTLLGKILPSHYIGVALCNSELVTRTSWDNRCTYKITDMSYTNTFLSTPTSCRI